MRHISSKLILLTILLVSILVAVNAFFSLEILRKETRAYTFQNQQLQTRSLAHRFELEFERAQEISKRFVATPFRESELSNALAKWLKESNRSNSQIEALGVFVKSKEGGRWYEDAKHSIVDNLGSKNSAPEAYYSEQWLNSLTRIFISTEVDQSNHLVFFPLKNAVFVAKLNLTKIISECQGEPVGVFNQTGEPILFCDAKAKSQLLDSPAALQPALTSNFKSGSYEKEGRGFTGLWGYSDLSGFAKVISVTDTKVTYRPVYLLGIRIALLVLMSIGAAIIISIVVAKKITAPLTEVSRATRKIAAGEFDTAISVDTRDETRLLADSVKSMAQKLKRLIQSEVEKTRLESQLELAAVVQRHVIPKDLIQIENFRISSLYRTADQCGGDWWAYLRSQKYLAILVGDVTGHGYASAMVVATTLGCLSMIQERMHEDERSGVVTEPNPRHILQQVNRVIFETTRTEMSMTAACIVLNLETGKFKYASAGHNPGYLLNSTTGEVSALSAQGVRLGDFLEITHSLEEIEGSLKEKYTKLVLYTDGVQDLGSLEKSLGRKGFKAFLKSHLQSSGEHIVQSVVADLLPLNQGAPFIDDVTFLVLEHHESLS